MGMGGLGMEFRLAGSSKTDTKDGFCEGDGLPYFSELRIGTSTVSIPLSTTFVFDFPTDQSNLLFCSFFYLMAQRLVRTTVLIFSESVIG